MREETKRFWMQLLSGFLGALILIVPIYTAVWFLRVKTLEDDPEQEAVRGAEGVPVESAESRTITLFLEGDEGLMTALLVRADTEEKRLSVFALPKGTVLLEAKKPKGLCEIYSASGASAASAAVRDTLFIETDGYLALTGEQLVRCVDDLGGFPITVLRDIELTDDAGLLELRLYPGTTCLTGYQAKNLIRACCDGRLDMGEEAITAAAIAFSEMGLSEAANVVYAAISGEAESDITALTLPDIVKALGEVSRGGANVAAKVPETAPDERVELTEEDLRQIELMFGQ